MNEKTKQVALVTGGGSGIGRAIARIFAANGVFTVIIGRDPQKLQKIQEELGDRCAVKSYDLAKRSGIPALVDEIVREQGRIDILVNNAGINLKKPFEEVTDEEFDAVIGLNLQSVFTLSREVAKNMLLREEGCILHISSMAAQYGLPKVTAYSASKTALEGLTRAMAVELSPRGIRVNAIAPGFIYSEMSSKALDADPERKQRVFARTPMGRMGDPEDIAEAARYLCSPAAKFVTGVVLRVDGGNAIGF